MPWRCWGCCCGVLVLRAGILLRLYRRKSSGISVFFAGLWRGAQASSGDHGGVGRSASGFAFCFNLLRSSPTPAGRGGEGSWGGQGMLLAMTPASRFVLCAGMLVWQVVLGRRRHGRVLSTRFRSRRMRRVASAASTMSGVLPVPVMAAAWCPSLRRCGDGAWRQAWRWFSGLLPSCCCCAELRWLVLLRVLASSL